MQRMDSFAVSGKGEFVKIGEFAGLMGSTGSTGSIGSIGSIGSTGSIYWVVWAAYWTAGSLSAPWSIPPISPAAPRSHPRWSPLRSTDCAGESPASSAAPRVPRRTRFRAG